MPPHTPEEIAKMRKLLKECQRLIPEIRIAAAQVEKEELEKAEAKKQKRLKLLAWAKENEPNEGWKLTDDFIKEVKLRKKFLADGETGDWIEYLKGNGMIVIKKASEKSDKLKQLNISKLKINEVAEYIVKFREFLKNTESKLKFSDYIINLIVKLDNILNKSQVDKHISPPKGIESVLNQIRIQIINSEMEFIKNV